jgi:hypothetical protein
MCGDGMTMAKTWKPALDACGRCGHPRQDHFDPPILDNIDHWGERFFCIQERPNKWHTCGCTGFQDRVPPEKAWLPGTL